MKEPLKCGVLSSREPTIPWTVPLRQVLARYPTPHLLMDALDLYRKRCLDQGDSNAVGWLFAELLEPGKRRRALSERLSAFFLSADYDDEPEASGAPVPAEARVSAWLHPH